jgi:hypothetical protein
MTATSDVIELFDASSKTYSLGENLQKVIYNIFYLIAKPTQENSVLP